MILKPNAKPEKWIKILGPKQEAALKAKTKGFSIVDCSFFPKAPKKKKVEGIKDIRKEPRLLITQEDAMKFFLYQLTNNKNDKQNTKQNTKKEEVNIQGKALC